MFILIVAGLNDSGLFANQTYTETQYRTVEPPSEKWDTSEIGRGTVKDDDYDNITYPVTRYFYLTDLAEDDVKLKFEWQFNDYLQVRHTHEDWGGWWWWYPIMNPYPLEQDYIVSIQKNNVAFLTLKCETGDLQVGCQISFDKYTYSSLTQAWDAGHLEIRFILFTNSTQTKAHYDVWTLVGQLMLFQAPDIHPALNAIVALPIWAAIIISILYVLDKILPF